MLNAEYFKRIDAMNFTLAHDDGNLPDDLVLDPDGEVGRYADYNERAAEVGDLVVDTPEAEEGFNPHKDDDDFSVTSAADGELAVSGEDGGRRGVSYTLDVARAGTAEVGALSDGAAMAASGGVPGRLERVEAGQDFLVVVDYAHKPGALEAVLTTLDEQARGRVAVVIGAGGDGRLPEVGAARPARRRSRSR